MLKIENLKTGDKVFVKFKNGEEHKVVFDHLNVRDQIIEVSEIDKNSHLSIPIGNIDKKASHTI